MSVVTDLKRAKLVSTPLIAITTPDQLATINEIAATFEDVPLVTYDVTQGPVGLNQSGKIAAQQILKDEMERERFCDDPGFAMRNARDLTEDGILLFLNAQRHVQDGRVAQGIALLRDMYKADGRTLVMLAPQITFPPELSQDVLILDQPLPDEAELESVLLSIYKDTRECNTSLDLPDPEPEIRRKAVEATAGLHRFAAEQAFVYSMEKSGIDLNRCWNFKRSAIEQTRGLFFYRGGETYDEIGGLLQFKQEMRDLYEGPEPMKVIVWLDEVEKVMTGTTGYGGDGGVSADQLNCVLTNMEDNGWTGVIALGPPGAGKSIIAKATGNTFNIPCIRMDLGAVKGSLVGESEQLIRQMMKVVYGIAGNGAFFIATCNSLHSLPPELKRRFPDLFFFDLPDPAEKEAIWKINLAKFGLDPAQEMPDDTDWTGSDIRNCCRGAYRKRRNLIQASSQIVPVAKQNPDSLRQLRELANGKFLSASYPGPYFVADPETASSPAQGRRLRLDRD
jgi:hypothetical protein